MKYTVRLATPEDMHLPAYRYSQLNDVATCPTLGALQYGFRDDVQDDEEHDESGPRNMATSAGSACHQVFAAVRLWELRDNVELFTREGIRLFGMDRLSQMAAARVKGLKESERMAKMRFCLEALYTSGFYDDPWDKQRTMANLELVCGVYVDRWDSARKVYVSPDEMLVGIELKFNLVIECDDGWAVRFVGTLDGLHWSISGDGTLVVHENKTAKYTNDAWASTFLMSHQVTGYTVAATTLLGQHVRDALILGSQIPLSQTNPLRLEPVSRELHHVQQWFTWFRWCVDTFEASKVNPVIAQKFTHSCGRFFSKCRFMPFCHGDADEKELILKRLQQGEVL